ncbi:MAG: hypothetical protein CMJ78_01845 [Planctomycetaceae bacterium]|nr:hypothetical protein [Planctomycetaceae bacterium]
MTSETPEEAVPKKHAPQWKRILLPVVVVVGLFGIGAAGWALGWDAAIGRLLQPKLVPVTGQIIYDGEPVTEGYVTTRLTNGKLGVSLGPLDDQGKFRLGTNINGDRLDGAYLGEHKLAVVSGRSAPGQFAPTPIVPPRFYTLADTPLIINVTSDPSKNDFKFNLTDE